MSDSPPPRRLVLSDGTTLAYHRLPGRSPGVVFLGGFRSDMTGAKALRLEALCRQDGRAFLRFDYRGHGASDGRFAEGTIGAWRGDALAVLDALTEGPQMLVGSSMGGWIMLLVALARPGRVAGLVGVACAADFTEEGIWGRLDAPSRQRLLGEGVLHQPSVYDAEPYPITRALIEEGRRHLLLGGEIAIDCPVRLLHGMRDADVPWQVSTRVAGCLRSEAVRVTLLKDGEHRLSRETDLALLEQTVAALCESLRT